MNHLYFCLSDYYKILRQQAVLLSTIAAICLFSSNVLAATPQQESKEQQPIQVSIGEKDLTSFQIPQGKVISVPLTIQNTNEDLQVGALSLKIHYDATVLQPVDCVTSSDKNLYANCNHDGQPEMILLNAINTHGFSTTASLASLKFHALGSVGIQTDLMLEIKEMADIDGAEVLPTEQSGTVEILDENATVCARVGTSVCAEYNIYLPILR